MSCQQPPPGAPGTSPPPALWVWRDWPLIGWELAELRPSSSAVIEARQASSCSSSPHPSMTLQLRTSAQLLHQHCSVGLTDWDMDKELKLASTTDQMFQGEALLHPPAHLSSLFECVCVCVPDEKLNDPYVVQRPSARASRRKDEFVWYDKMSGETRREPPNFQFHFYTW